MWFNFHTHSHFCDGKGGMRDFLGAAKNAGMSVVGFSSHAPLPFERPWCMEKNAIEPYRAEIEDAGAHFPELEVYSGLETDFIPDLVSPSSFDTGLDYTIGSIHFVDRFDDTHWEIDTTSNVFEEGLRRIFNGDIRAAVSAYLELTREMVRKAPPDIVGHLDKIKVNARHFGFNESDSWYLEEIDKTLMAIRNAGVIIEVNTRGLYKKKCDTTFPSPRILERIHHYNIPVTISSDAHHPAELTLGFDYARALLEKTGFKTLSVLRNGSWSELPLKDYGPAS